MVPSTNLPISQWKEDAFEVAVNEVRDLSAGKIKRIQPRRPQHIHMPARKSSFLAAVKQNVEPSEWKMRLMKYDSNGTLSTFRDRERLRFRQLRARRNQTA